MELQIKFADQSESFTLGVEFGRLLGRLEKGETPINNGGFPIHKKNANLLIETCKMLDYSYGFSKCVDESGKEYEEYINFHCHKRYSDN